MSIRVQSQIWEHSKQKGTLLLILLAIGDFASDDGVAFPSVKTIALKARLSERGTQYLIQKLELSGELTVERNGGPRGCNLFRVQSVQGANQMHGGCKNPTDGGAVAIAPEPSGTIKEPPVKIVASDFEPVWAEYPNKDGKKEAQRHFNASVKTVEDLDALRKALVNYKRHLDLNAWKSAKAGKTWLNNWRDWIVWDEAMMGAKDNGIRHIGKGDETAEAARRLLSRMDRQDSGSDEREVRRGDLGRIS